MESTNLSYIISNCPYCLLLFIEWRVLYVVLHGCNYIVSVEEAKLWRIIWKEYINMATDNSNTRLSVTKKENYKRNFERRTNWLLIRDWEMWTREKETLASEVENTELGFDPFRARDTLNCRVWVKVTRGSRRCEWLYTKHWHKFIDKGLFPNNLFTTFLEKVHTQLLVS